MESAAAYRSPLSILRSARLNDDEDLVLRDDHQRNIGHDRRSEQATTSSTAAAVSPITPVTASASSRIGTANNIYRSRPVTNLKSYVPFNIFGMKSPFASSSNANNDPTPPRGAFPPRIIEEESRYAPSRIDETINSDDGGGGGLGGVDEFHGSGGKISYDEHAHYEPSHPWFNRYSSEFDNDENDDNNFNSSSNNNNNNKSYMTNNRNQPMDGRPSHFEYMVAKKKERESQKERRAIMSTTFNFTNSIIGAGAMGLGGAFAASGGGISIIILIGFAYLTKRSLDLIVDLSSCPLVINLARKSKDSGRDRTGEESDSDDKDGMSDHPSTVAPTINDFLKQDSEYLQSRRETEDVDLDTHQEVEVAEDEEKKESSHLITQEEEKDVIDVENDSHPQTDTPGLTNDLDSTRFDDDCDVDSNMQTPLKISDLFADCPLPTPNESDLLMKDESMEPRFISPLHIDEASSSAPTTPIVDEEHHLQPCTYEELGYAAFGSNGRLAVLVSKSLYSFGCLIAYVVVVRDNFGLALRRIIIGPTTIGDKGWIYDDNFLAFWISAIFMLPLSCPRTMESLTKFSFLSILSIVFLTFAIVYMYFSCTNPRGSGDESSFYENWLVIRSFSGLIESLGCFVFTFVCHHTVHLAYESLPLQSRSPKTWRQVSTNSIAMALETSLAIGVFAYLTFGSTTPSDVLTGYPANITLANVARLLLCMNMVLTFPLPFLTCRELIILLLTDMHGFYYRHDLERFNICITMWKHVKHYLHRCTVGRSKPRRRAAREGDADAAENDKFVQMKRRSFFERWTRKSSYGDGLGASGEWLYDMHGDGEGPTEALLREESESDDDAIGSIGGERGMPLNPSPLSSRSGESLSDESTVSCTFVPTPSWILPDCNGRQLTFFWHAVLTFILWLLVTISAIKSPSLIDVLDLVGAFTGTMIAFILPAVFSLKLKGYSKISIIILGIGGTIGMLGTSFSLVKFLRDSI